MIHLIVFLFPSFCLPRSMHGGIVILEHTRQLGNAEQLQAINMSLKY